jgi:Flp pilus assembly protein TadB
LIGAGQRKQAGDGLQPERTALSWSRTSFGALEYGALLMVREVHHYSGPLQLVPAGLAVAVALLTYLVGVRRQRLLRNRPLPSRVTGRMEIQLVGGSIVLLILATTFLLPL